MQTQSATHFTIKVVIHALSLCIHRPLAQQFHSTIRQQPNTDIHQCKVGGRKRIELFQTRFLEHKIQLRWIILRHHKHPVMRSLRGFSPESIANHVSFRHFLQRLRGSCVDISARHQRMQRSRSRRHDAFIEGNLQIQQRLIDALSSSPTKHRNGEHHLAARCISRQSSTLSTSVQQDAFLLSQPRGEVVTL